MPTFVRLLNPEAGVFGKPFYIRAYTRIKLVLSHFHAVSFRVALSHFSHVQAIACPIFGIFLANLVARITRKL
jgi:hypothetical protein